MTDTKKAEEAKKAAEAKKAEEAKAAKAKANGPVSAVVTNNYSSPLGLPKGPTIEVGKSVKVDNWNALRNHDVIKAWLNAEVISVEVDEEEDDL